LADFYQKQYEMHEDIVGKLQEFRARRQGLRVLPTPRPSILFGLLADPDVVLPGAVGARYRQLLGKDFVWSEYAIEPSVSDVDVKQARYEVCALAVAGLVKVSGCQVDVLRFVVDDATLVQRLSVVHLLDPAVDLQELSNLVPKVPGVDGVVASWSAEQAEKLARLVQRARTGAVPASDIQSCPDMFGVVSAASQAAVDLAGEQIVSLPGADNRSKRRRGDVSADLSLSAENLQLYVGPVFQILKACFLASRNEIPSHEVGKKFGGSIECQEQRQTSCSLAFRVLQTMGLGQLGVRGGSLTLLQPPQPCQATKVATCLADMFKLDGSKLNSRLQGRAVGQNYTDQEFDDLCEIMKPIIESHAASLASDHDSAGSGPACAENAAGS
jgi:hypothetical protein